jgi:hypothetical protein
LVGWLVGWFGCFVWGGGGVGWLDGWLVVVFFSQSSFQAGSPPAHGCFIGFFLVVLLFFSWLFYGFFWLFYCLFWGGGGEIGRLWFVGVVWCVVVSSWWRRVGWKGAFGGTSHDVPMHSDNTTDGTTPIPVSVAGTTKPQLTLGLPSSTMWACMRRHTSSKYLRSRPSTIFSTTSGFFPESSAWLVIDV